MNMNAPGAIPVTIPHDAPPHVCGRCRNPFTIGNPNCVNAKRADEMGRTTPTGVPYIDCKTCGRFHPETRRHCEVCGSPSIFPHDVHSGPAWQS